MDTVKHGSDGGSKKTLLGPVTGNCKLNFMSRGTHHSNPLPSPPPTPWVSSGPLLYYYPTRRGSSHKDVRKVPLRFSTVGYDTGDSSVGSGRSPYYTGPEASVVV